VTHVTYKLCGVVVREQDSEHMPMTGDTVWIDSRSGACKYVVMSREWSIENHTHVNVELALIAELPGLADVAPG